MDEIKLLVTGEFTKDNKSSILEMVDGAGDVHRLVLLNVEFYEKICHVFEILGGSEVETEPLSFPSET